MSRLKATIISIILSVVFSYALLYSTLELPRLLNELLREVTPHYGIGEIKEAEQFVESVRPLGYLCLAIVVLLMILGFVLKKHKLSVLGSLTLLLPTFSYFASVMFFLAGIGILRIIWLPFIEFSPGSSIYEKVNSASNLLELGDIVYLPYDALRFLLSSLGWYFPSLDEILFSTIIIVSSIIFFISCATWFYFRFQNLGFAKSLVYKYSRHPQFFSFLLWSYGLLIYDKYVFSPPRGGYFAPPPIFWNVFAFLLIGVALSEEKKMLERYGEEYEKYRSTTSFMMPLSKTMGRIVTLPVKLFFKKTYPEKTAEIILTLVMYFIIILLISMIY